MDRKNFVQALSLSSISYLIPPGVINDDPQSENQQNVGERKNVALLSETDPVIQSYRKAVTRMKALPASDARSWDAQARIHLNSCPHNNWFFLPWHRAYLHYFEEICKLMCEDESFRLPYWDWTSNPEIPSTFWGEDNPLFDSTRVIQPGTTADTRVVGSANMERILGVRSFENFASGRVGCDSQRGRSTTGQLEGGPHNYIHGRYIQGNMGTMLSPKDPIFWLHHGNCDRLWTVWNARGNANTNDPAWLNCNFANQFYDRNGTLIASAPVSRLLNTRTLGYRYQGQLLTASGSALRSKFNVVGGNIAQGSLTNDIISPNSFREIILSTSSSISSLIPNLDSIGPNKADDTILQLYIEDIEPPVDQNSYLRIFINCDDVNSNLPVEDPRSIGFIYFFGNDHSHHSEHGLTYSFEISRNAQELYSKGAYSTTQLSVQILAIPIDGRSNSDVKVKSVRMEVQSRAN